MVKLRIMLLVAFLAMLLVVPGIPATVAMDSDMDGIDDETDRMNRRDIMVNLMPGLIMVRSDLQNAEVHNRLIFFISNESDGLRIKMQFHAENQSFEAELELNILFRALIEFVDKDGNGIYNESDDLKQYMPLNSFKNVIYSIQNVSGTLVYHFNLTTTNGVFSANIYLSEEFALINNTLVSPVEMKIQLKIDFNFVNTTSKLALYVRIESNAGFEDDSVTFDEMEGHRSGERGISSKMNNTDAFFTWEQAALCDGLSEQVRNSPRSTDGEDEKLYLIYPNSSLIFQDPTIGLALATIVPGSNIPFTGVSLVLMAISIVAITAWLVKRRTPAIKI